MTQEQANDTFLQILAILLLSWGLVSLMVLPLENPPYEFIGAQPEPTVVSVHRCPVILSIPFQSLLRQFAHALPKLPTVCRYVHEVRVYQLGNSEHFLGCEWP